MTEYIQEVTARRRALQSVAAGQRSQLGAAIAVWQKPARTVSAINNFVRNPLVLAGFGLIMAKMPWKRLFKVSRFAYKGWKIVKILQLVRRFV